MRYTDNVLGFELEFKNGKELICGIMDQYAIKNNFNFDNVIDFIRMTRADIDLLLDMAAIEFNELFKAFYKDNEIPKMNADHQRAYFEELYKISKYASAYAEAISLIDGDFVLAYVDIIEITTPKEID